MPSFKTLFAAAALASLAQAKTIKVTATEEDSFDPDEVKAAKGDIVEFHFEKGNHSVVAGEYKLACSPLELKSDGSFFSGFIDTDDATADDVFRVTINDTKPIAFYSSVDKQCPGGMVGIINPDDKHTVDEYKKTAAQQSSGLSPGREAFGGEVVDADDDKDDDDENDKNDKDDKNGDKDDDKDDGDDDGDDDGEDAAGSFHVPVFSMLAAVGVAFLMA